MVSTNSCPGCGNPAPIVLRGTDAYCTVCSTRRTPFASTILNLAGKPARFGGIAARVFGWGAMLVGLFIALTVGLVVQAIASMVSPETWLGWAIGIPIALAALFVGALGIFGGRRLGRAGEGRLKEVQLTTLRGLARHQRGLVTPAEAARALNTSVDEADLLLAALAKQPGENVSIDLNRDDEVCYVFGSAEAIRWRVRAEEAGISDLDREAVADLEEFGAATQNQKVDGR